jgi:hypothetical protein
MLDGLSATAATTPRRASAADPNLVLPTISGAPREILDSYLGEPAEGSMDHSTSEETP